MPGGKREDAGRQAIRNLKALYAASCDDNYNPDGIAALFTEDAVWESQGLGRFDGEWTFSSKTSAPLFHTPYEEGWAKTPLG